MKNLKYKMQLPIKPTQKPDGEAIAAVALAALDVAQHSLLSPAAVISCLRCALEIYERNIEAKGFDVKAIEKCELIGVEMAKVLLETRASPIIVGADGKKVRTGLLDASGNEMVLEEPEDPELEVEAAASSDSTRTLADGSTVRTVVRPITPEEMAAEDPPDTITVSGAEGILPKNQPFILSAKKQDEGKGDG